MGTWQENHSMRDWNQPDVSERATAPLTKRDKVFMHILTAIFTVFFVTVLMTLALPLLKWLGFR